MRSDRNWPHVLSGILGAELTDVTCSSATTANIVESQSFLTAPPVPPQLEAVKDGTDLVTLAIGGNDINLGQAMMDCWTLPGAPSHAGCADQHLKDGKDTLTSAIQALGPKVGAALDQIKQKSAQAKVFVVGYLTYWQAGGCPSTDIYTSVDADYLQAKFDELHRMLATQAKAHGATYVDIRTPSTTHGVCAFSADRWLEGAAPVDALAYHPNATGMENAARIIADSIG
jgi:lysophospholipase L1-like esterase